MQNTIHSFLTNLSLVLLRLFIFMALRTNSTLHSGPHSDKHDDFKRLVPVRVGFGYGLIRRGRRMELYAKTNTNMETVNGKKVNGIRVDEIPYSGKRRVDGVVIEEPNHEYLLGRFVEDRFVYRQSFVIRSYEIGPDKTATMETVMNLLQVCDFVRIFVSDISIFVLALSTVLITKSTNFCLFGYSGDGIESCGEFWGGRERVWGYERDEFTEAYMGSHTHTSTNRKI